jgi:cellobiose phosphorylase
MQSAHQHLNTPFGLALMAPPYDGSDPRVAGTSTYPPGAKENGGIFAHANTWAVIAAARLGWSESAYQYYRQLMPLSRTDPDHYAVEPYVYCGNIAGPTHPQFGYGRNAWLSGTASWMYVAATQWILGIRPTFEGLQVSPVIPVSWSGFTARRTFRSVTYHITVQRLGEGSQVTFTVDGQPIAGNIIPFPPAGQKDVSVTATLK